MHFKNIQHKKRISSKTNFDISVTNSDPIITITFSSASQVL